MSEGLEVWNYTKDDLSGVSLINKTMRISTIINPDPTYQGTTFEILAKIVLKKEDEIEYRCLIPIESLFALIDDYVVNLKKEGKLYRGTEQIPPEDEK